MAAIVVSSVDKGRLDTLFNSLASAQAGTVAVLREKLALADVRAPADMPPDVVTLNSRVRFALADPYEELSLDLSLPDDIRMKDWHVSVLTPAGTALLGQRTGDSVGWTDPDGVECRLTVLELMYQPERSGELHRWKGKPHNCVNAESRRVPLRTLRESRTVALNLLAWPAPLLVCCSCLRIMRDWVCPPCWPQP